MSSNHCPITRSSYDTDWPPAWRFTLVQEILKTLDPELTRRALDEIRCVRHSDFSPPTSLRHG